ncbi:MAG: RNA-binding region [Dehalococcoidia bacterium]|nr:RNA-binding region [Dehalococcoidia bacterium]
MNIFVGNLSHEVSEDDLKGFFTAYGHVDTVAMIGDFHPPFSTPRRKSQYSHQESRRHAYVDMPLETEALAAIQGIHGMQIWGLAVAVLQALPMERKKPKKM